MKVRYVILLIAGLIAIALGVDGALSWHGAGYLHLAALVLGGACVAHSVAQCEAL